MPSLHHFLACHTLPRISRSPYAKIRSGSSMPVSWITSSWNSSRITKLRLVGSGYSMLTANFDWRFFLSKLDFLGSLAMTALPTLRSPVFKLFLVLPATARLALSSISECSFLSLAPATSLWLLCSVWGLMRRLPFFYSRCILKQDLWDLNRNFLAL